MYKCNKQNSLLTVFIYRVFGRKVNIDPSIKGVDLARICIGYLREAIRGFIRLRRPALLGRSVVIQCRNNLFLNSGLIRIGDNCLLACLSRDGVHLGSNFKLGSFSRIVASGTLSDLGTGIRIGDNVGIGEFSYIGGAGGVTIGSDTIIGQFFSVHPENHIFDEQGPKIRMQGVTRNGIHVGRNCWVGAKVTLLDGASIGDDSVIAAGSVVRGSFPKGAVLAGVPAKLIRMRDGY